jgi:2-methylisocitrate lyase-like PEP mutase family enzyme
MKSQAEKADYFRSLHKEGPILILPNAWDVPSARSFENSGFPAIATTSAGLMVSLGYPDGESIEKKEMLIAVRRIARAISLPLSADIVAGFGRTADDVVQSVREVIDAGAIGVNIEDLDHSTGKLYPLERQLDIIRKVKAMGESIGVPVVINARTDALRHFGGDERAKFEEALHRALAFRDAEADCVYPMGLTEYSAISNFVKILDFPINVMIRKGLPLISILSSLGVRRVSFGPAAMYAAMGLLKKIGREVLDAGTYDSLLENAISFEELNALALPRKS